MNQKLIQILFQVLLTLTLFSIWAGFALLVVNKLFYKALPGYTIGRICIWELVTIIVAAFIAKMMIMKWGNIQIQEVDGKRIIAMDSKFGVYFFIYFILGIGVGLWQFLIFSQKF